MLIYIRLNQVKFINIVHDQIFAPTYVCVCVRVRARVCVCVLPQQSQLDKSKHAGIRD